MIEKHFNTIWQVSFCLVYRLPTGSGFRPASSPCERFRQQLVSTRAHVKYMKLCVLTNSRKAPSRCTSISKYYKCGRFFPAIKWWLVVGARLHKKEKQRMKHDVQSVLTAPGFRGENERRAAHILSTHVWGGRHEIKCRGVQWPGPAPCCVTDSLVFLHVKDVRFIDVLGRFGSPAAVGDCAMCSFAHSLLTIWPTQWSYRKDLSPSHPQTSEGKDSQWHTNTSKTN